MTDYRIQSNRREGFIRWWAWSMKFGDCDPAVWLTNYLNKRYEHNKEQKFWFAWLYGNTYNLPTAWVLLNEFPDYDLVDSERIDRWNSENFKRLRYQTDTKWNKGHLPRMYESYKENIGTSQEKKFKSICSFDNEKQNFDACWSFVKDNFFKFGRYSSWFYLQHLKETCGLPIEASSMMLSDYSGSRSHRNGLLYSIGREDLVDVSLDASQYEWLEAECRSLIQECKQRFPEIEFNQFNLETALCAFKKIFRRKDGRYLGYYLDRQAGEVIAAEGDRWDGIVWDVIWQARKETLHPDLSDRQEVKKHLFDDFLDHGNFVRSEWMFDDEKRQNLSFIDL